jgi:hypothetical protein
MKIFKINDCEWYIGESLNACMTQYKVDYGVKDGEAGDPMYFDYSEVSEQELDELEFNYDEDEPSLSRSFRDEMAIQINKGGAFPRLFATTEW